MAIPLEGMVGYVRTRPKHGTKKIGPDGKPAPEMELWIDSNIVLNQTPTGPVVGKPPDCAGIIYGTADGKLKIEYPE